MAKRNVIWVSMTIVTLIVAYLLLTGSFQWGSYIENKERQIVYNQEKNEHTNQPITHLSLTALIPQNEPFDEIIRTLSDSISVKTTLNYLDTTAMSYTDYEQFLLTEESGDIHLIPNEWVLPLAVQGYLMPLDRVISTEYVEGQTIALVESMKWNSNLWAAPYLLDPYIVIPRKDVSAFIEAVNLNQEEQINKEDSEESSKESTTTNEQDTTPSPVVDNLESDMKTSKHELLHTLLNNFSDHYVVNSHQTNVEPLFHFIHYMVPGNIHSGYELNQVQYELLNEFQQHHHIYEHENLEWLNSKHQSPLFLVVSWSELDSYLTQIEEEYDLSLATAPIYWTNGYSFVIRQQTKQHQVAGQWIENFNRKISTLYTANGMPVQQNNLKGLTLDWQRIIISQYNEQFEPSRLMKVSTKWASQFGTLQQKWQEHVELSEKLNYWLEQYME